MAQTGNTITITNQWQNFMNDFYVGTSAGLNVYWRVQGRYTSINSTNITVGLLGTLVITRASGTQTGLYFGPTSTVGGQVGTYQAWGIGLETIHSDRYFYIGETQLWYGSVTVARSTGYVDGVCRFYSTPYGWTSDDLSIGGRMIFPVEPSSPTASVQSVSNDSITIEYGVASFGTPNTGTVSLHASTVSGFTPSSANQISSKTTVGDSTFSHSNLSPNTTYYYKVVATNGTLQSISQEISATTGAPHKIYGSVGGVTKQIDKLYGSVNGETKEIIKLYGSVNGQTKRIF